MDFFNKDGHLNTNGLSLYADAVKLNKVSEVPGDVSSHLRDCRRCQQEMIELTSIMTEVDQAGVGEHPYLKANESKVVHMSKPSAKQWFFRIAVAAIIGLLVLFSYQRFFQKDSSSEIVDTERKEELPKKEYEPSQESPIVVEDHSAPEKKQAPKQKEIPERKEEIQERSESQYLANYIPNEELESMVGTVFRSGIMAVNEPGNDANYTREAELIFRWENENSVKLSIFDNEENIVFEQDGANSPVKLKSQFDPGLYYWKLETAQDLLHLGKFTITEK